MEIESFYLIGLLFVLLCVSQGRMLGAEAQLKPYQRWFNGTINLLRNVRYGFSRIGYVHRFELSLILSHRVVNSVWSLYRPKTQNNNKNMKTKCMCAHQGVIIMLCCVMFIPLCFSCLVGKEIPKSLLDFHNRKISLHANSALSKNYKWQLKRIYFNNSLHANPHYLNTTKFCYLFINDFSQPKTLLCCEKNCNMSDIPSNTFISHLSNLMQEDDELRIGSYRDYIEFLRVATLAIQKGKYPRLVAKLFKEILESDDPRGLSVGEMSYALNLNWSPVGRVLVRRTRVPQVFILRFSNAGDFATAITSNPNRVHGKLLSLRIWSGDENVNRVDFNMHDFWITFTLRSDLVERGDVGRKVAEKVGKVLALIGPNADEVGVYRAHVMVNLLIPLKNYAKIIIIDGNDREVINVKIYFDRLPFATCKKCWTIDHRRDECGANLRFGRSNVPRITIQNEEFFNIIMDRKWVQRSRVIGSVQSAVAGLRIYDSDIDRERSQGRKRMRMEIEEDQLGITTVEVTSTPSKAASTSAKSDNNLSTSQTDAYNTQTDACSTAKEGVKENNDLITLEELRKAIKGKGKVVDESNKKANNGKEGHTTGEGSENGDTKAEKQLKKFSSWARMLGQYVNLGKEKGAINIGKERSKSMLSSWIKIDDIGDDEGAVSTPPMTPTTATEKVQKEKLQEAKLVDFVATTDMSEKELRDFAASVTSNDMAETELQGRAPVLCETGEEQDIVLVQKMQKPEPAEKQ